MGLLRHDLRVGDALSIDNGRVVVRLEQKSGQVARLSIEADPNEVHIIKVPREESAHPSRKGLAAVG